jgi:hypothetical protein
MDRKIFTIVLSLAMIGGFFLPYSSMGTSGYDFVFRPEYNDGSPEKYTWLISPAAGVLLLAGTLNKEQYIGGRGLLIVLSLLSLLFIAVRIKVAVVLSLEDLVKRMGYGYWIALVATVLLLFYNPRPKA